MKKITVIGGDARLKTACKILSDAGFSVDTFGLYDADNGRMEDADVLLLPVPTTRDSETVFAPLSGRKIRLDEVAQRAGDRLILTCNYLFDGKNCVDYGKLDSYSLLNAIPTAEGAIKLAVENTDFTLWRSRVLVIGYGRTGKILADRLKAMGCFVTVAARRQSDLCLCNALGFETTVTGRLNETPLDYDIIFNTVDVEVISEQSLDRCNAKLMLDLSSKGGFNLSAAKRCGIRALKAPGLPGIIAPRTAGEILAGTVKEIILSHI